MAGIRQDTLTVTRERLEDTETAAELFDALTRKGWPRYKAGMHPKDAFAERDRAMRAWIAGGPAPDVTGDDKETTR